MLMEELGDGRERPGFFTNGACPPAKGAGEHPSGPTLLEDDNSGGVVYAEARNSTEADGTVYACSPDGSVTQLRHPVARLRVLGAMPHWL